MKKNMKTTIYARPVFVTLSSQVQACTWNVLPNGASVSVMV